MEFREDIQKLVAKYNLKNYIFVGCDGEVHYTKWFGEEKEHLIKMLNDLKEDIELRFAVKDS